MWVGTDGKQMPANTPKAGMPVESLGIDIIFINTKPGHDVAVERLLKHVESKYHQYEVAGIVYGHTFAGFLKHS